MGKRTVAFSARNVRKAGEKKIRLELYCRKAGSITGVSPNSRILSVCDGQRQANFTGKKRIILKTSPFPSKTFLLLVLNSNFHFIRPHACCEKNHAYALVQRWDLGKMSLEQAARRTSHVLKAV